MSKAHNRTQEERDDQFMRETFEHMANKIKKSGGYMNFGGKTFYAVTLSSDHKEDIDRCIKILEERKK